MKQTKNTPKKAINTTRSNAYLNKTASKNKRVSDKNWSKILTNIPIYL